MVDFDSFKQINDRHDRAGGDSVLRRAVQMLQAQTRGEALLARNRGEEFVVLVAPVPHLPVARRVAERMRQALEETTWRDVVPGLIKVTASLGVTVLAGDESLEHALARAGEALYRAKNGGCSQE
jgi:diguanylate cyclase (GGDEF)-like protein